MKVPLAIDLCCGIGGWAKGLLSCGYRVIGFDIQQFPQGYPGDLVLQDIHTIDGRQFRDAAIIVASPPCERFALYGMPFAHAQKRYPPADLDLINVCFRIREESGVPTIIENVRALEWFLGRAEFHWGPFYLWGDVPSLRPQLVVRYGGIKGFTKGTRTTENRKSGRKYMWTSHKPAHLRAEIPFDLARWIGEAFLPSRNRSWGDSVAVKEV